MSALRFDGRAALVTGAGRGLGRAYALLLAARGASVVVNDPGVALDGSGGDREPAESVVAEIVAAGGKAIANFDSVATEAGAAQMVEDAVRAFGSIDILVNNAGNFVPRHPLVETTTEGMMSILQVHLMGTLYTIRAAWPHMLDRDYGRVINTTSHIGYLGSRHNLEYSTAKGALHGLTRSLSLEAAETGIRVNGIAPGALTRPVMRTKDIAEHLAGPSFDPGLVAPTVAWLAHEDCRINGEFFGVMAGTTTRIKVAETPGFGHRSPTPEGIRDHFDAIMADGLLEASGLAFGHDGESRGRELSQQFEKL